MIRMKEKKLYRDILKHIFTITSWRFLPSNFWNIRIAILNEEMSMSAIIGKNCTLSTAQKLFLAYIFAPSYKSLKLSLFLLLLLGLLFILCNIHTCHLRFAFGDAFKVFSLVLTFECISHRGYVQFSATHLRDYSDVAL